MSDGFEYNPAVGADYTSQLLTFSTTMEEFRTAAQTELTTVQEGFTQAMGSDAFTEAQLNINLGIQECQEVLARQSNVVDTAFADMYSADGAAAGGFG